MIQLPRPRFHRQYFGQDSAEANAKADAAIAVNRQKDFYAISRLEVTQADGVRIDILYEYSHPSRPSTEAIAVALAEDARAAFREAPTVVVRVYPGRTQMEAADLFQRDAAHAAGFGYSPPAQSWGEGKPGRGRVAMLGMYSMVVKPKGYLTVTYTKSMAAAAQPDAVPMKTCPMCAEEVKAAARICRFCRYEFEPISEQ